MYVTAFVQRSAFICCLLCCKLCVFVYCVNNVCAEEDFIVTSMLYFIWKLELCAGPSDASPDPPLSPLLGAGKGRGRRRKGAAPRPPPLLLVQDAEAALTRLQERVSALLLRSRAPSPPTPTLCPSSLPGWSGAAPLWQKSALLDGGSTCLSDFYTPELREFITPWESGTVRETKDMSAHFSALSV